MTNRKRLYQRYLSTHAGPLYGEFSEDSIRRQFKVWDRYYGRLLNCERDAKILEIGCGNGGFLYYLRTKGFSNCYGVDLGDEQIAAARALGLDNVECIDASEFLLNSKDTYSIIVARDLIEHLSLEEGLAILEGCHRALVKRGLVIIHTVNGESPFFGRVRYGDLTHQTAFTKSSVSQLFRVAGFDEISVFPAGPVPHGVKSAVRWALWKPIELSIRACVLIESGRADGIYTRDLIATATK